MFEKKAQIWVETAIYTLIGLVIIAILLTVALPQIEKVKDKGVVEQTISALNTLNSKVEETEQTPGNIRIVNFKISKGKIEINSSGDFLRYTLENTKLELSEPGEVIREGNIYLETETYGSRYNIILTMNLEGLNITYNNKEEMKTLNAGSTPYKIQIENVGDNGPDEKTHIDFNTI